MDPSATVNPLCKLFWEEQQKAFRQKEKGMRWHPMVIRLAILLHSKSKAAYEILRKTGVLKLPGSSTLREYTSAYDPQEGFSQEVMEELKRAASKLHENQRFVALLHDEMSIRSDLVFDVRTGALVGFVNKDTWTFDHQEEKLATQALVFYVVGMNSSLKMSIGYFGTKNSKADELYQLLWAAIGFVEECGLKVISSTSDKASPNQKLYQLHQVPALAGEVCFKTTNLFAPERHLLHIRPSTPHQNCPEQSLQQWEQQQHKAAVE